MARGRLIAARVVKVLVRAADRSDVDVQELLGNVAQHLSVSRAFGTAYEKDGSLVIPVAIVAGGGGAGSSESQTNSADEITKDEFSTTDAAPSSGLGGGYGGVVMPAGVYVVKNEQVRWVPAVNANLVIVVAFLTLRMIARNRRRRRRRAS